MSRIFLVDDHAMVRDGMRAVLEGAGYHVVGESDHPVHALAEMQRLAPDVVLLDVHLGDRSGLEILSEIQRRGLPLRCVVLTMSSQSRHVADALRMGAMGYVLKGAPAREVLAAIESVLMGRRYVGTEVAGLVVTALTEDKSTDALSTLSMRERQILTMVVRGQSSVAIGNALHLSHKTVDTYRSRLMAKLGVPDITALVRWAIRVGLIDNT